jgi:hypothetical protein
LARRPAHINHGRILAVDRSCLAVRVGLVLIGVKYLDFIEGHQVNPTVSTVLVLAVGWVGTGPFYVELAIAEGLLGLDVSGAWNYLEVALLNFPKGRTTFDRFPGGKIFAIEENKCI